MCYELRWKGLTSFTKDVDEAAPEIRGMDGIYYSIRDPEVPHLHIYKPILDVRKSAAVLKP